MSDYHCKVVRLTNVQRHPNADTLNIAEAGGYPIIFNDEAGWKEGDLVAYIPVDSVVPDTEQWAWLKGARRIKAKRLRGIFSMGMVTAVPPGLVEGDDCMEALGIEKYVNQIDLNMNTGNERDPGFLPVYTDIDGYRRRKNTLRGPVVIDTSGLDPFTENAMLTTGGAIEIDGVMCSPGEEVVITEKIHGANARFVSRDGRLWVGSHKCIKARDESNMWWKVAIAYNLEEKLAKIPGIAIYGEVYGQVQDLKYGKAGLNLKIFDALDTETFQYFDYDRFIDIARLIGLETVPELYRGPWSTDLLSLAEGSTVEGDGKHVREGIVIRPTKERVELRGGRVILKMVGEGYLLRKGG